MAASLAMELGLHRPETLQKAFADKNDRLKANRVMCSIFVLDHGWSAALGLPRNIDDSALDCSQLSVVCVFLNQYSNHEFWNNQ